MAAASPRRVGRRPGRPDTREQILVAARALFAGQGFDGTSVRAIAEAAGVDASLISHYFGGKEGLFRAVMDLPVAPADIIARVFTGASEEDLPRRLVEAFFDVWEGPESGPAMISVLRRVLADPAQLRSLRSFLAAAVLGPATARLATATPGEARLRIMFTFSQLLGVVVARQILQLEPLASLPRKRLAEILTPVVARYLTGDLADAPFPEGTNP